MNCKYQVQKFVACLMLYAKMCLLDAPGLVNLSQTRSFLCVIFPPMWFIEMATWKTIRPGWNVCRQCTHIPHRYAKSLREDQDGRRRSLKNDKRWGKISLIYAADAPSSRMERWRMANGVRKARGRDWIWRKRVIFHSCHKICIFIT